MKLETEKILSKNDPILEKIILQILKPEIESTNDVFHDLMSCILNNKFITEALKESLQKH
jgi:translation initiation factor 2 beta subunit (eIF-2beta)/eIF-5